MKEPLIDAVVDDCTTCGLRRLAAAWPRAESAPRSARHDSVAIDELDRDRRSSVRCWARQIAPIPLHRGAAPADSDRQARAGVESRASHDGLPIAPTRAPCITSHSMSRRVERIRISAGKHSRVRSAEIGKSLPSRFESAEKLPSASLVAPRRAAVYEALSREPDLQWPAIPCTSGTSAASSPTMQ